MSSLEIQITENGSEVEAVFVGQIDEDADFSPLLGVSASTMVFDLGKVSLINSCGIREWIEFQKSLPQETKITYRKCPQVIVEQLNIVKGFIRENSLIESFFAPYYNEAKDEEVKILLTPAQVVEGKAPAMNSSEGEELEFDEVEMQYFNFLKNG